MAENLQTIFFLKIMINLSTKKLVLKGNLYTVYIICHRGIKGHLFTYQNTKLDKYLLSKGDKESLKSPYLHSCAHGAGTRVVCYTKEITQQRPFTLSLKQRANNWLKTKSYTG